MWRKPHSCGILQRSRRAGQGPKSRAGCVGGRIPHRVQAASSLPLKDILLEPLSPSARAEDRAFLESS